jgi:hypothetical protein
VLGISAGLGIALALTFQVHEVPSSTIRYGWLKQPGGRGTKAGHRSWLASEAPYLEGILILWQVLDSNKSGGFLARGDTAQTAAD